MRQRSQVTASRRPRLGIITSLYKPSVPQSLFRTPYPREITGWTPSLSFTSRLRLLSHISALTSARWGSGPTDRSPHVSRIGHPILSRRLAFIQHRRIGHPIIASSTPAFKTVARAQSRQHGYCDFETHLAPSEYEAAAPAVPPGRGQRSQGSTTVIFPTHHLQASSRYYIRRLQSQSCERCDQCGEWLQGPPEPN